ncbi:MAG TPA: anti-sigma factor [Xanthobacteraceae bacterium]|jgi:anti-sigma factor RsiW|nr:anti-sigma factor [Xanthobacteraceae bacterium]
MTDRDLPVAEDELHAYVDGELPPDRLAAVEAWLATHPQDMARVTAWRSLADSIRTRYGVVATERVPVRLSLRQIERAGRSWRGVAAAATVAAFLAGGLAGWMAHGASAAVPGSGATLTADALDAYKLYVVEVRHPVEVPGSESAHLTQWLSKRVGYELRIPDLEKVGLKLVGGRLLPGPRGAAAFFMYEGKSGERFTLYSTRSDGPDTALRYNADGPVAALTWADGAVGYVVSGEADRDRLHRVAESAYAQLERAPAR